jgi:ribose transport system ATP-binding protein
VKDLTVGYQQIVEIAKALSHNAKVLIMDEPSAPLTENEVYSLFKIVKRIKENGVSIIYISHRLDEIFSLGDRVTVFRDGKLIKSMRTSETNTDELVRLMVNRELGEQYPKKEYRRQEMVLKVKGLKSNLVNDVSFEAYRGEILGFAGLVGAGRTEVARAIFGADEKTGGEIFLHDKSVIIRSPSDAIRVGIGLIPEDRKRHGLLLDMSVKENITYANMKEITRMGMLDTNRDLRAGEKYKEMLRIKTPSLSHCG